MGERFEDYVTTAEFGDRSYESNQYIKLADT